MNIATPNRTCGRCGAPVASSDVTCPRCSALLAAYEAPHGAGGLGEPTMPLIPQVTSTTITQPTPEHTPAGADVPLAPQAPAVMAERKPAAPAPDGGVPPAPTTISLASSRKKAQPVAPHAGRRQGSEPRATPPPSRKAPSRRQAASADPLPVPPVGTQQASSPTWALRQLAFGLLIALILMGLFNFEPLPMLVLGAVTLSLFGVMRSAAKASGRKTTSMYDPNRRDHRGR